MLGVYELNDVALLKDVFLWAYGRPAEQYVAVGNRSANPIRSGSSTGRDCAAENSYPDFRSCVRIAATSRWNW